MYIRESGDYSEGGFGGGGCGCLGASGGGGGYSGGGGGAENSYSGGGGCFLKYTGGRQLAALDNEDEGFVIISLIGLPKEDPKPMPTYLTLSFILGGGVAAWCGCLMQWISKCMDWVLGEDQELIARQRRREQLIRNKQMQQEADYEAAIHNATIKRFMEDQDEGFSSESSFHERTVRSSVRRRESVARRQRKQEAEERRGRSVTRRGKPQRVPYRMADAGSPPPSTKPAKSRRASFKSIISDVASVLTMSKKPVEDAILEEGLVDEEVIVDEEPQAHVNRAGYAIPKVKTIDDPDDVVIAYQRKYKAPKELEDDQHKSAFAKQRAEFAKAADKYGTSMFMGMAPPQKDAVVPIAPVAKLGEKTKLNAAEIHDGYAAAMAQSYALNKAKIEPKAEVKIDVPCERMPTPPETDYDDPDYDSEVEAGKKAAREEEQRKQRVKMRTTNATKSAFGAGKHVLARMQQEGWTVGPGGQLIKNTAVKPNKKEPSDKAREIAAKIAEQYFAAKKAKAEAEAGAPPAKSPKLEKKVVEPSKPKPVEPVKSKPVEQAKSKPVPTPEAEPVTESEVEFKLETTDSEYNPIENFSIAKEMKRIAKEKERKEREKKASSNAPVYESDCADLPEHLNHNVSVFDRMRDRVAAEKAENRKINPFASATETEQETDIEFKGNETETDFEIEMANMKPQSIKPQSIKPQSIKPKPVSEKKELRPKTKDRSHHSQSQQSDILSDMSDLSDMPTLSDLTESEIDEDIRTVKELIGATIQEVPLEQRLKDINFSDDEPHSELKLTDIEQSQQVIIKRFRFSLFS